MLSQRMNGSAIMVFVTTLIEQELDMSEEAKAKDSIIIIDGSNLGFRMFFALERTNMRNSAGDPTWAVYGTFRAIFDLIENTKPTAMAAAFDLPEPSFRHETYEGYKANRPDEMPDDLQVQWESIKDAFRYLHIPMLEEPGLEADDLIGIMVRKAEAAGQQVLILSGDQDLFQLVNDNVSMAVPQRGGGLKIFRAADVYEKLGVWPKQVPDYKGIAGDSSDNIVGIRGLGPKAASTLLEKYGSLEGIYENIDSVSPAKTKEKLIEQEESARFSKYLATILVEDKVKHADTSLENCKLTLPDVNELVAFFKKLEFNSMLKRLPIILKPFNNGELVKFDVGDLPEEEFVEKSSQFKESTQEEEAQEEFDTPLENVEVKPFIIADKLALKSLVKELEKASIYAIDLETTGINTLNCEIVGWAFAIAGNTPDSVKSFYIPVLHQNILQINASEVLGALKPILEDESKLQIIQNAKFEIKILRRKGINTHNNFFDTMLASYVDNTANKHGLKAQSIRVLRKRMTEIEEIIGTGKKQITMDQAPIDIVAAYAAADAFVTLKLYKHYEESLSEASKLLLKNIESPLVEVLADIESTGVSLDTQHLANLSEEITIKVNELEKKIWQATASEFNIASTKQLSTVLFENLGIEPIGKRGKSGNYSTSSDVLEELLAADLNQEHGDLIKDIIEYRTLTKLLSTYVDNLPRLVSKETNRLHSDFNQVVTATGRLSSSNPNLQNIPIRTEYGKKIRKAFVAKDDDHLLISADYSQIELRLLAHMANEEGLIEAFKQNADIHKRTAMLILDKSENEIEENDRRLGKTLNFALIYMQGPFATAKQLGISMKEAKSFIKKYFEAFPKIQPYMNQVLENAHQNSYVETLFARRRHFRNINSANKMLQKEEERQAFNAPLQGTAADIMKKAMIDLQRALKEAKCQAKLILQVHDELVLEVAKSEVDKVKQLVLENMENACELKVPLLVDLGVGPNWLDAK